MKNKLTWIFALGALIFQGLIESTSNIEFELSSVFAKRFLFDFIYGILVLGFISILISSLFAVIKQEELNYKSRLSKLYPSTLGVLTLVFTLATYFAPPLYSRHYDTQFDRNDLMGLDFNEIIQQPGLNCEKLLKPGTYVENGKTILRIDVNTEFEINGNDTIIYKLEWIENCYCKRTNIETLKSYEYKIMTIPSLNFYSAYKYDGNKLEFILIERFNN